MYSMEDTEDHRGPIYDTINDGDSGHSTYSHNGSSSSHLGGGGGGLMTPPSDSSTTTINGLHQRASTFVAPPVPPSINGMQNPAFSRAGELGLHHTQQHDYDVPEGGGGSHRPNSNGSASSPVGTVTINGIAV